MLAALHREALPKTLPLAPQITFAIPLYDVDAMLVEVGLMLEWYLPDRGAEPTADLKAQFVTMWRNLLEAKAASAPITWALRDFHPPTSFGLASAPISRASASSTSRTRCWVQPPTISYR